jgi:hypothetical protein
MGETEGMVDIEAMGDIKAMGDVKSIGDIDRVLIDNLKETLKSAQIYLLTGTVAALFLLLLAIQGKFNLLNEENVAVPFIGLSAPVIAAAFIALAIYILSGIIVIILDNNCRQIEDKLDKGLMDAVLTYPSLIRTSKVMGVGAALVTFLIGTSALAASWYEIHGFGKSLVTAAVVSVFYLILSVRLLRR